MCGHVGIAGKLEYKDEALFRKLLIFDYLRGPDSTGAASIRKNGKVEISKLASHPIDLFDTKRYGTAITASMSVALIGHNRLATKGIVNNTNAHPYQYDHIVGAHNGTLSASSWKALEEILGEPTNVDSQAIFACIAKIGIDETVKHLQGAWALVWADMEEGTLNFLRNDQRPLWYANSEDFKRVFYASEWEHILAATSGGTATTSFPLHRDDQGNRFFQFLSNHLYQYKFDDLIAGYTSKPAAMGRELKGKEVAVSVAGNFHGTTQSSHKSGGSTGQTTMTGHRGQTRTSNGTSKSTGDILTLPTKKVDFSKQKVYELPGTPVHPMGGYFDKAEFERLAKYGCSWCTATVEYGEKGVTVYEATDTVLCPDCSGNGHDSNRIYCVQ